MANPLPPAIHRHADQQLDLGHFERRGVPMPQQIANQTAIVGHLARAFAVADAGGLHDRLIVAHDVDQADEAVVEHGKLLPAQLRRLVRSLVAIASSLSSSWPSTLRRAWPPAPDCPACTRCSIRLGGIFSFSSAPTTFFHCRSRALPSARYSSVTNSLSRCSAIASAVLVVVLDDLFLVLRSLGHGVAPGWGWDWGRTSVSRRSDLLQIAPALATAGTLGANGSAPRSARTLDSSGLANRPA